MSVWFRFLWVIVTGFFRAPLAIDDVSVMRQRVWPDELDINIHMNNAKYLAVMDLGRTDWIVRTGAWRLMRYERMAPVVGGAMVRYRRSLQPFQRYLLKTRLLGADQRWLYIEQVMECRDGIACIAIQRAAFTRAGKLVPSAELAAKLGHPGPVPPPPDWVAHWTAAESDAVAAAEVSAKRRAH